LHTGRHLGAREAAGEILVFVDDDVIARPGWLGAIRQAFEDPAVALVGGKSLPGWEGDVPWWIDLFRDTLPGGWTIGALSLIDLGDWPHDIAPEYVYGCNYSVRRDVLFSCGGFHPDSLPRELIARRGDGETALSLAIGRAGHRARYVPEASLLHRVPPERLTKEYFRWRFYCQGISNSYAEVRRQHGMGPPAGPPPRQPRIPGLAGVRKGLQDLRRMGFARFREGRALLADIERAKRKGFAFHQTLVAQDPALLRWVLKERYF
jgi:GT2 family glycosyltransferase